MTDDTNIDINRFERIFKEFFEATVDRVEKDADQEAHAITADALTFAQSPGFRHWLTNGIKNDDTDGVARCLATFRFAFAIGRRYGFTEWAEADNKPTGLERIEDEVEEVNRRG